MHLCNTEENIKFVILKNGSYCMKCRLLREISEKMKQGEVNVTSELRKHRVTEKLMRGSLFIR